MSVNFVGINNGSFDASGLISQLVQVETQSKITPLQIKKFGFEDERFRLRGFETSTLNLIDNLDIKDILNGNEVIFPSAVTTTDADKTFVDVTAGPDALNQSFDLNVTKLATSTSKKSATALSTGVTGATVLNNAAFKGGATMTGGTVTINGETQTYTVDPATDDVTSMLNFLSSFTGVSASLSSGKVQLTGVTNLGSSGDTSNVISALGLDNAQISGGNVTGLQNIDSPKSSSTLSAMGITGTNITINGKAVTFDPATDTLSTLISKINNDPDTKVDAAYDALNGEFLLTNNDTGALSITTTSTDSNIITQLALTNETLGDNAEFSISTLNGGATIVSNSNTVEGVLEDVTLDLNKITTGVGDGPVTVTIAEDADAYADRVEGYLDDINSLVLGLIGENTSFSNGLASRIRNSVGQLFSSATDTYTSAIEIGVESTLDAENKFAGFQLDRTAFKQALEDNPGAVNTVLYGKTGSNISALSDGSKGIFTSLSEDILEVYVDPDVPANGILRDVISSLDDQINRIDDDIERAETNISDLEARLTKQFSTLDVLFAQLSQQQAAIASLVPAG